MPAKADELSSLMIKTEWDEGFRQLWVRAVGRYRTGRRTVDTVTNPPEQAFLAGIGCSAQEFFDFVEDHCRDGDPDLETTLAVQQIRHAYLVGVPAGAPGVPAVDASRLPAKSAAVDGIAWLPRLIAKARLKLRGELPAEFMYGCGGDRPFLRRAGMTLPGFLQLTWDSGENDRPIVDAVRRGLGR